MLAKEGGPDPETNSIRQIIQLNLQHKGQYNAQKKLKDNATSVQR